MASRPKAADPAPSTTRVESLLPIARRLTPLMRPLTGRMPGFGTIVVAGRSSGRLHRTPVNVFREGDDWIVALTYGSQVQWVRNVMGTGGCALETRGRTLELTDPELVLDPTRRLVPRPVRVMLGFMRVSEFLRLRPRR